MTPDIIATREKLNEKKARRQYLYKVEFEAIETARALGEDLETLDTQIRDLTNDIAILTAIEDARLISAYRDTKPMEVLRTMQDLNWVAECNQFGIWIIGARTSEGLTSILGMGPTFMDSFEMAKRSA